MIDLDHFDASRFVRAAAPAVGLQLSEQRLATVAEAFALMVRIAGPALTHALPPEDEPAPVFVAGP